MPRRTTWNGSTDEALALLHALRIHCECRIEDGRTVASCASHSMLARDQRAVDGLLFMRRMAARLLAAEFDVTPHPPTPSYQYEATSVQPTGSGQPAR